MNKKLTEKEYFELDSQYAVTPALCDTFSASGEHYILVMLLNSMGFYPTDRENAIKLTEELLANGYA